MGIIKAIGTAIGGGLWGVWLGGKRGRGGGGAEVL